MGERKQLEATTNRSPSFPCSAVVERSDGAEAKAGGGLAGGELVDASAAPFVITVSCTGDSGVSMCASLDATLKEMRRPGGGSKVVPLWVGHVIGYERVS